MVFIPLVNNITLLLSLSILYSIISRRWDYSSFWHRVIAGILFGIVAIIGMMNPLKLQPGVIFDGRSIILSIGGLFGGPITAILSTLISSTYRIYLGGAGAYMGVGVIVSSSLLGVIYYYIRKRYKKSTNIIFLFIFGIVVHLNMLILTSALPSNLSNDVFRTIALPVLIIYPTGSLLMCLLFLQQESRLKVINALKESEEKYRLLVEKASNPIVKLDSSGRIIFINSFAQELIGFLPSEVIGKFAMGSIIQNNNNSYKEFAKIIEELIDKPERYANTETEITCKNGSAKWVSWNYKVIKEDNTNTIEILCVGNEITEKKKVELALIESEQKYRQLYESLMDGFAKVDLGGKIIDCNNAFLEMVGYSKDELLTLTYKDITPKRWHEFERSLLNEQFFKLGYTQQYEKEYVRKDGEIISVELRTYLSFKENLGVTGMWAIIRDITQRKRAEIELVKSEEKYRTIIELASDTIILGDENGNIIGANLKATELTGYSTDELMIMNISHLFSKSTLNNIPLRYDLLQEGKVIINERLILRKNSSEVHVEMNSKKMPHNTYISIIRDITERINAEKSLRENEQLLRKQNAEYQALNEELNETNQKIREINEKLIVASEKAQESDRLKSSFLANMSHEIRTPMNGIIGFSELLLKPNITPHEINKYVDIITKSSKQLLSIINDIIDISKIEAGQVTINNIPININQALKDVSNLYSVPSKRKNNNIKLSFPEDSDSLTIISDETKINQIVGNLVSNAIKFTTNGEIEIGYAIKVSCLELFVKDNGIGIDPENHTLIFERFRQVEGTSSSSINGTGLGLAISKSLVEMLGGKIWVDSALGCGTKFYFTLPIE